MRTSISLKRTMMVCGLSLLGASMALALWCNATEGFHRGLYSWINDARLASSVAWLKGINPYPVLDEGPILTNMYGPVNLLAYSIPCALAADPQGAINNAYILNLLLFLIPPTLFLAPIAVQSGRNLFWCLWGILFLGSAAVAVGALYEAFFYPISDAPALALGAAACFFAGKQKPSLWVAATLAVLAVWTKQTEIFLFIAIAIHLWIAHGRQQAVRWCVAAIAIGAVATVVFVSMFGLRELRFNMITIPACYGLLPNTPHIKLLVAFSIPLLIVLACAYLLSRDHVISMRENPWMLLLLAAVLALPLSIAASAKLGGASNSFHCTYYAFLAATVAQVQAATRITSDRLRRLAAAGLTCSTIFYGAVGSADLPTSYPFPELPQDVYSQQAYEYLKARPGTVYFPWHPLASLYAEGYGTHYLWGCLDRSIAGYELTPQQLQKYLPPRVQYMAYPSNLKPCYLFYSFPQFFPESHQKISLPGLDGWTVCPIRKLEAEEKAEGDR